MNAPCTQDCPDRSPTCHIECERYKEYRKKNAEEYRENEVDRYIGEKFEKAVKKKARKKR